MASLTVGQNRTKVTYRQGRSSIAEPRFSYARKEPYEPDAGHAAVGSRVSTLLAAAVTIFTAFFISIHDLSMTHTL